MAYDIFQLMDFIHEKEASDLHLSVGRPPTLRLNGSLRSLKTPELTPDDTIHLSNQLMPPRMKLEFRERGGADFSHPHGDKCRFRVSIYRQRGSVGLALRLLPTRILSFDQLGLAPQVKTLLDRPRGLILVTGPTGSGKTTTLATLVDHLNQNFDHHIVTIEDPIEYYHSHGKSIMTQRELGTDVGTFHEAMRRVLRMDPDVILLGEMRDLETISAAITAAETGHLVFGTLHTTGSARTVNRIIDAFPANQQEQIRAQLSVSLIGVISQVLLKRKDEKGRIAAFEVMLITSAIANLIRKNETNKIQSSIQTSKRLGMVTLDDYLLDLVRRDLISAQEAVDAAQDPRDLEARL